MVPERDKTVRNRERPAKRAQLIIGICAPDAHWQFGDRIRAWRKCAGSGEVSIARPRREGPGESNQGEADLGARGRGRPWGGDRTAYLTLRALPRWERVGVSGPRAVHDRVAHSPGGDDACRERRSPDRPLAPGMPIRRSAFPGVQSDREPLSSGDRCGPVRELTGKRNRDDRNPNLWEI